MRAVADLRLLSYRQIPHMKASPMPHNSTFDKYVEYEAERRIDRALAASRCRSKSDEIRVTFEAATKQADYALKSAVALVEKA